MSTSFNRSAASAGHATRFCLFGKQAFTLLLAFFLLAASAQATVRYVKTTGSDANTGLMWAQAYASIQKAIDVSASGDEIWVAAGTYKPTLDPFGNATPADPRDRTFYLKDGVKLYGGFAGTETMLFERNWVANLTTLSGDFNGNDVGFTNNGENAYHVVLSVQDGANTAFDGFTVKGGNANGGGLIGVEGQNIFQFYGGGMENRHSSLNVLNCTFKENSGNFGGGANNYAETPTPPTFTNCSFLGNNATLGGGFYNTASATLINCVFSGNYAAIRSSGGMYNFFGFPTLLNCSFSGNKAAFSNDGTSNATLINCILWGNSTEITNTVNATTTVTNSIVQGGYAGTGNLNANPSFVNQPNFNNAPTTAGNLRLTACSFAMDAGLDEANSTTEDRDGNARQFDAVTGGQQIDMGAYEDQNFLSDGSRWYVNASAATSGNGTSWACALRDVQTAINVSDSGDEIWVAAGTYKPTLDPFGNATPADLRDRTFYLKDGVKLYGGFAGTETMLSERNWVVHLTTLSGDFNGNDVGFTNNGENAYHVVLSVQDGADTEFNGFTVKGGNANGGGSIGVEGQNIFQFYGGGMENRHTSLNVLNCTFKENSGNFGGGANNYAETPTPPTFTNCSFLGNNATLGGGFYNTASATLINCVFSGNYAAIRSSGGMYNFFGFPTLLNCSFSGNKAAFSNDGTSNATLINCILWGNSTEITNTVNATTTVTNSIVQGGYAGTGNLNANPSFVNQPNFNNAPTTAGNLRLTTCSFAMDAGLDEANSTTEDLDGNARQFDAVAGGQQIDMGAYELQSTPPTISITCPSNFIGGQCGATSVTYPTPTASGNCDAPTLFSGIASGGTFPVGETTVVWKATNNIGQNNTCSFKVTVTGNDTQAPSITCPANQTRSTNPNQCQANVTYPTPTATDNCALAAGSPSLQSGIASGGLFPKGINTVVWRATDQAGLTKTCSFRITVNDTQAPTITCPANQAKTTDPGVCTAVATYTNATFTDNCAGGSAVKISGLNSGFAFPKGVNNVVFRATDAAGNQSLCTMTVTVTDAQLPTITCPSNIAVTGTITDGVCSAMVMYASPTATDNCGILSNFLSSGLASGSVFPLGVTTNTWRATDLSGLTANCAFTVTVSCGTAPGTMNDELRTMNQQDAARSSFIVHRSSFTLAPNPATTAVIITTEGLDTSGATLTVFDAQGKMIWQQRSVGEQTRIDLDDRWQSGVYLVRLNAGDQVLTQRLVVSR